MTPLCSLVLRHGRSRLLSRICARTVNSSTQTTDNSERYIPIYRLTIVEGCSAVNKLKKINLLTSGVAVPLAFACCAAGFIDDELPVNLLSFSMMAIITTVLMGKAVTRLIGIIYLSEDKEKLKISYLDHWGRRQNAIHAVKDVGPLTNCSKPLDKFCMNLEMSSSKPYLISFRYGSIEHPDLFQEIFDCDSIRDEYL